MFAKKVISSARFLRMPATARLLYYDLGMYADDDGIVEAFTVLQMTHAALDDLHILAARGFVKVLNEDMVSYICDWSLNNFIRKDRYVPSLYRDLMSWSTNGQPTVNLGEGSEGKERIVQVSLDEERESGEFRPKTDTQRPISARECFIDSFGREPDKQFLSTLAQMMAAGITEEQIICQIQKSVPRSPRIPEAYILSTLKQLGFMQNGQHAEEEALSQWELAWLERARRHREEVQNRQEVQFCEKEES